ncbi:MAG: cellulase family glycosylhydrolase [Cytophagales bacterium]
MKTLKLLFLLFGVYSTVNPILAQDFIQRQGKKLYFQGNEIYLRGMCFGNLVFDDKYADSPNKHHSEIDLQRINKLGMNAIRFYMNYKTFENDAAPYTYKQSGWDWIDSNIQWAKNNNVYLILNMHIPQGGYQSQCKSPALWTDSVNQKRLIALWSAIAERYKNEPQIAGYDLVNEPTPSGSINNWSVLAQKIINAIREKDNNHLVITERALALDCNYSYNDGENNYPKITEENLMYTVHMYEPYYFTHQNLSWANTSDGGSYPNYTKIVAPADATYATGDYDNPSIKTGTSDWTEYTGTAFTAADSFACGRVVFTSGKIGSGKVYFDDIVVKELDVNGNLIRILFDTNLVATNQWFWTSNNTGTNSSSTSGHGDNYAITITGNTGSASIILPEFSFKTIPGHKYVISGWMKGENVPSGAYANITTEYYYSPSGDKSQVFDYDFVKNAIVNYASEIEKKGFPVYFGEFGAGRPAFLNNKGGERWVSDCMRVFDSLGYHFTYHAYKESSFGFYDGWDTPIDTNTVNVKLKNAFLNFFGLSTDVQDQTYSSATFCYPNPVKDYLTVTGFTEIFNAQGIKVTEGSHKINMSKFPSGVYTAKSGNMASKILKE